MRVLIRRLSADGTTEDLFEGAEIVLGRATDCTISLPGLMVALRHARLLQVSGSTLKLESLSPTGVELNGLPGVQTADFELGDVIGIGGHRVRLTVAPGNELALEVELAENTELARRRFRSTLSEAGLSMRRPALWLALVTLILGLLVPLALRYVRPPEVAARFLPTDRVWLTDGIDNAHRHFGADCTKCHETLFVPVRDEACLACHQGVKQHSDNPAILKTAGIEGRRCASCHREHQGPHGAEPSHPGICVDCHGHPERFADFPGLKPVRDFGEAHPEFRPTVNVLEDGRLVARRMEPGRGLHDHSGLVFAHDVHLAAEGVRGPDGLEKLDCAGCHVRRRGEASFEPVSFATHCQRCHQLDVDVNGTVARLPHGDSALARAAVLTYARAPARDAQDEEPESTRRRPGESAPRGSQRIGPEEIADEAIEHRVCAKCHETTREAGKPVAVRPPEVRASWMVHAQFTHEAHAWQKCDDCHSEQQSATADDLSLPVIASCRDCHGGVNSAGRLQSTCIDCHRFHEASRIVMGALADGAAPDARGQGQP